MDAYRILVSLLIKRGIITNIVEYPGVPKEEARLRIQIMSDHTNQDLDTLVSGVTELQEQSKNIYEEIRLMSFSGSTI